MEDEKDQTFEESVPSQRIEKQQQTFEEILEMQRVVEANRGRMIDQLLDDRITALGEYETKLTLIALKLKGFGYKKTRQPRAAILEGGTVVGVVAKKRTRKKAA